MLQLLLFTCAFAWSPTAGLAILFLWMLFGDEGMLKELRAALSSVSRSRQTCVAIGTGPSQKEELNLIAQDYFLHVYGGLLLPQSLRVVRKALSVLLGLPAVVLLLLALLGVVFGHTAHQFNPVINVMVEELYALGAMCVLSYTWEHRLIRKTTGLATLEAFRESTARRVTARLGGTGEFLEIVESTYGKVPELVAWFFAPYLAGNAVSLGLMAVLGTGMLLTAAHFSWSWSRAAVVHLHLGSYGMAALSLLFFSIIITIYLSVLVFLNTSKWGGTRSEHDYFPLQVFCRDLLKIRETSGGGLDELLSAGNDSGQRPDSTSSENAATQPTSEGREVPGLPREISGDKAGG